MERKNLRLGLSGRSDLQITFILFIVAQAFAIRFFAFFTVELISLPMNVKDSTASIDTPKTVFLLNLAG